MQGHGLYLPCWFLLWHWQFAALCATTKAAKAVAAGVPAAQAAHGLHRALPLKIWCSTWNKKRRRTKSVAYKKRNQHAKKVSYESYHWC